MNTALVHRPGLGLRPLRPHPGTAPSHLYPVQNAQIKSNQVARPMDLATLLARAVAGEYADAGDLAGTFWWCFGAFY